MMKSNDQLTPQEVIAMGLRVFRQRFGFRPRDAYEKQFFAATGKRPTLVQYEAIRAGVIGSIDISTINMQEEAEE